MLSQVRDAMAEASRHFVNLDELMEAAGQRLAELMGLNGASSPAAAPPRWRAALACAGYSRDCR